MRSWWTWIAIAAGVVVLIVATAAIGNRDKSGDTVSAGAWAQSVCGAVGTWRGEMEAIVEDVRTPPANGATGTEEPQSETPQGRTGLVRSGLERAVQATDTLVEGIDNAGVPDTDNGKDAAKQVSDWAASSQNDLESAQDTLDKEADTLEAALKQVTGAVGAVGSVLTSGVQTLGSVARLDPALVAAFRDSSTCQELRKKEAST